MAERRKEIRGWGLLKVGAVRTQNLWRDFNRAGEDNLFASFHRMHQTYQPCL